MAAIELDSFLASEGAGPGPSTLRHRRRSEEGKHAESPVTRKPPLGATVATAGLRPRFTTLALPRKYDHLPLVTKLWLQSRVVDKPPDRGRTADSDGEDEDDVALAPPGTARKITWRNFKIQLDLLRLLGPRCIKLLLQQRAVLAVPGFLYLVSVLAEGLVPSASLWATSQMLDLVERSFAGFPTTWQVAVRVAGTAIALETFESLTYDLFQGVTTFLQEQTTYHLERLYVAAQLNLTVSDDQDETYVAVVDEAAVFSGFKTMTGIDCPPYDSWDMLRSIGELVSTSLQLGMQTALIYRSLRMAMTDTHWSTGNSILVALSLGPLAFNILYQKYMMLYPPVLRFDRALDRKDDVELNTLRGFAEGQHRQELVLFGLRPYILRRWDEISRKRTPQSMPWGYNSQLGRDFVRIGFGGLVKNAFYVLLAVRAIPTTMTLGALHLHRESAEMLHNTLEVFKWRLNASWQLPYFLAAMFAAQDGPAKIGPQLDYEEYRDSDGMRLEARGLSLTYKGADEPTIRDVNLSIAPGTSLAIVGFNGSGKTTLAKALLGLHSHQGSLRINGIEIEDYDSETLHKRMSCLFQSYDRYYLSVRKNVGFGDTSKIDHDEALERALERGGAQTLVKNIGGLERRLAPGDSRHPTDTEGKKRKKRKKKGDAEKQDAGVAAETSADGEADAEQDGVEIDGDQVADDVVAKEDEATPDETDSETDDGGADPGDLEAARLSGGQWQKIALSRCFTRSDSADLILLDEPNASLDPRAEYELFNRIHALSKRGGKRRTTTIFISHRFSTVRKADKIAFVEDGRIIEYGTHAELLALGGRYHELFNLQKAAFDD